MPAKRCPRPCAKKAGGKPVKKGHTKDKGTFNFFPDPKRGKGRSVLKRPARAKTTQWKKVPYVRSKEAVQQQRMDRTSWKRKLADLLQATDVQLVRLLREDQLLHDWTGKTCPRCGKGRLSKAQLLLGASMPRHRCNRKGCQAYINPHHLHPIFKDATGASATPLQTQSTLLFLLPNRIPHPAIHRILHINHKAIEDMENRLSHLRKRWVEEKEKSILFGNAKTWADVEADEATFSNTDLQEMAEDPAKPIIWEQWCGIVQRGAPHTLVLKRLTPQTSARRAPGPGAIRKIEWQPLATKHLRDRIVVLHTDAAKSYELKMSGVLHDHVRHCKKRVKVKGKWMWKLPTYVRVTTHKDPKTGRKFKTKGGTQIIDRAWRFLKDRIHLNQHCRVGTPLLRAKIRSAQYESKIAVPNTSIGTGMRIYGFKPALCVHGMSGMSPKVWLNLSAPSIAENKFLLSMLLVCCNSHYHANVMKIQNFSTTNSLKHSCLQFLYLPQVDKYERNCLHVSASDTQSKYSISSCLQFLCLSACPCL